MKVCLGKNIAQTQASIDERNLPVVKILRNVENILNGFVCGQSVHNDGSLDIGRFVPARDVLLFLRIDAAPNGNFSALPEFDEIQGAIWSRSKNDFRTPTNRLARCRKTSTIWTRSDAARTFSNGKPVVDLESGCE